MRSFNRNALIKKRMCALYRSTRSVSSSYQHSLSLSLLELELGPARTRGPRGDPGSDYRHADLYSRARHPSTWPVSCSRSSFLCPTFPAARPHSPFTRCLSVVPIPAARALATRLPSPSVVVDQVKPAAQCSRQMNPPCWRRRRVAGAELGAANPASVSESQTLPSRARSQ